MKVKFDSLNRFETPKFYLCNPGGVCNDDGTISNVVGILPDTSDEEIVFNFNAISELSLRVPRVTRQDPDENTYTQKMYRAVQNRRLIFVEDIGFFVISSISECYDDGIHYKEVRAESCEVELQDRAMTYVPDGTYYLLNTADVGSSVSNLIDEMKSALHLWSFADDIDPALDGRCRTFEDVSTETNLLSFMLEDVQDAYECLFVFDIMNRVIHIYDQANYVRRTNIHITGDDLVTELEISEDASDLYTALNVCGGNDIGISAINPLGTNEIVNFDYYRDWMSGSLGDKVGVWTDTISAQTSSSDVAEKTGFGGVALPRLPTPPDAPVDDGTESERESYYFAAFPYIVIFSEGGSVRCAMSRFPFYKTGSEALDDGAVFAGFYNDEQSGGDISAGAVALYEIDGYGAWTLIDEPGIPFSVRLNSTSMIWSNHDIVLADDAISETGVTRMDYLLAGRNVFLEGDSSSTVTYYDISLGLYELMTESSALNAEYSMYETRLDMYKRCYDNIVATGNVTCVSSYNEVILSSSTGSDSDDDSSIKIMDDIVDTLNALNRQIDSMTDKCTALQKDIDAVKSASDTINTTLRLIHDTLSMSGYFNTDEYNELLHYRYEGTYTDEYIVITDIMSYSEQFAQKKELYDRAVSQLKKIAFPTQEFTASVENFIFSDKFKDWSEQLETGCLVNVELEQDDVAELFLTTISINYHDHDLKMTFGNRYNRYDPRALFTDALGSIKKSANTVQYIKDLIYPIKSGELDSVKEAIENSRLLTKTAVLASSNQEIVIDDTGLTGRKVLQDGSGEYDPRQVKLINNSLVFTEDDWESCSTALGEIILDGGTTTYGLNAKTVMGEMIIGNNLTIYASTNDETGEKDTIFNVMDGRVDSKISSAVEDVEGKINGVSSRVQQTEDAFKISFTKTEHGDGSYDYTANAVKTSESQYSFDDDGLLIQRSDDDIINQINNKGMYVKLRNRDAEEGAPEETVVLSATNVGVEAINLKSVKYLVVGESSRFEDYSVDVVEEDEDGNMVTVTKKRTGCYFIEDFDFSEE